MEIGSRVYESNRRNDHIQSRCTVNPRTGGNGDKNRVGSPQDYYCCKVDVMAWLLIIMIRYEHVLGGAAACVWMMYWQA